MSGDDQYPNVLTGIVQKARSGRSQDVQALLVAIPTARFLLPLKHAVPEAPVGQAVTLDRRVDLSPHYLPDGSARRLALFTYFGPLDRIVPTHQWMTDGDRLQLFTLPGPTALQLAHRVVDAWNVMRLVIDPGAPSELVLTRNEIASLLERKATSLSEYAGRGGESCLPLNAGDPLPPRLVQAIAACLKDHEEVREHRLESVFDPARDKQPRLILRLWTTETAYRNALVNLITSAVQHELPPPGEMEVRFE
ncbi:MAG TPA: SseB family protein [Polyangiaceae bacterium]|nr:SseB family protein [Polyangiaceae bacterium]